MAKKRAAIVIDDLDDIKPGTAAKRPDKGAQAVQDATAEAQGFTSREGAVKGRAKRKPAVRYPVQLNLKIREEDSDAFIAIRDELEVPNGKLFAMMLAAYQEKNGAGE